MSADGLRVAMRAAREGYSSAVVAALLRPTLLADARGAVESAALLRRCGQPGPAARVLATAATLRRMARGPR